MDDRPVRLIIYGETARQKILAGVEKTARAVGTTLGSKGKNVSLERNWGPPVIMHDGVTVARNIVLEDPFEDQAAQLVISAAQNTNNEAGDGTTTATILTHAIIKEAFPIIAAGSHPMAIRSEIEQVIPQLINELHRLSKPVKTFEEMKQIATISAADEAMGTLIATAIQKVGENGVATVQEGTGSSVEVEYKEGMDLPKGWLSPYLVTDQKRMETVFEGEKKKGGVSYPYIAIVNQKVDNQVLIAIAEKIITLDNRAKFLIIADEFAPEAIQSMILSRLQGGFNVSAIRAPEFGEHRTNILTDIAVLTGGKVIGGPIGIPVEQVKIEDIGTCEKVVVGKDNTIIIGGRGKKKEINNQIEGLKKLRAETKDIGIKNRLETRLSKLIGGVAVISVGAPSEAEMREKKERIYDAVNATRAAISEGIVPGGGVALIRASRVIKEKTIGAKIIRKAVLHPAYLLISNAGVEDAGHAVVKILESKNPALGYNVDRERYEDMVTAGIIDPVKVTRSALSNAASIAMMLITTDCMIVRKPQPKKEADIEGIGKL